MNLIPIFIVSLVPVIILLRHFYRNDYDPEPKHLIVKVFLLGVILILPAIIMENYLSRIGFNGPFFNAFLIAALTEEFLKFFFVLYYPFRQKAFNHVVDGIVYTITISLGFAAFENILYVMKFGYNIGIFRAFTAIPLHALASGIMGYYIGSSKFESDPKKARKIQITGLIIAIVLHGFYNFWLFTGSYLIILSYLQIFLMWRVLSIYCKYSDYPEKKSILTFRQIFDRFFEKFTAKGWIRIAIGSALMIFVAISSTNIVISLINHSQVFENVKYLLYLDFIFALLSYFIIHGVEEREAISDKR